MNLKHLNPNDALDAEAVDNALAEMIGKLRDHVVARPSIQVKDIPKAAWRDVTIAAVSGFLAKRAEQRIAAGDDFMDLVESRARPFNDPLPFGGEDTETLG